MKTGIKIYLILALCLIGAGIIYLSLPLSGPQSSESRAPWAPRNQANERTPAEQASQTILYRILDGKIETNTGERELAETVQWKIQGETVEMGRGRFLGQAVFLKANEQGQITEIQMEKSGNHPQRVRVLLQAADGSYFHETATIQCTEPFWGVWDGEIKAYPPGAQISVEGLQQRGIFYPLQEEAQLTLTTPKGTVTYAGQLEITAEENGYSIVNEVGVETYLKGVVPSEMPGSYGKEAAMVQAVCARSYTYSQWMASEKYMNYGAQLDDGTSSQVYGGVLDYEDSAAGVEATWGQVLTYEGGVISANYFSTSCGYTANGQDVWGGGAMPYLQGQPQYTEEDYGNLAEEEAFHQFITNHEVDAYEKNSPWFRWTAALSLEQLQENTERYLQGGVCVKEVQAEQLEEATIHTIGELEDIFVYERSQTGMACSLLLVGTERTIVVEGPTQIRKLLGQGELVLGNGEAGGLRELLPSAFISIEKIKDTDETLVSVKLCGGGYGHGVGMSQNGVKGMLEQGYAYEQILAHYYPGTELTNF